MIFLDKSFNEQHPRNYKANQINKIFFLFSTIDTENFFSFTSGHSGALELPENNFHELIFANGFMANMKRLVLVLYELALFIIFTIFPIKNGAILLRTIIRYSINPKPKAKWPITLISLGSQRANSDPYFKPLLRQMDGTFDYLKIVGGKDFFAKDFIYIESTLSFFDLINFAINLLFLPFTSFVYLFKNIRMINGFSVKVTYFILGLREVYRGRVAQNNLIKKSVNSWILNNTNAIKKIIFPMEGRSWEQSIVRLMNINMLASVGYIHCVITPKHLSLLDISFYKTNEVPNVIIAPSQMVKQLVQKTFSHAVIRKGYFLRGRGYQISKSLMPKDVLLFALTGDIAEGRKIMNCILNSGVPKKYKVRISLNSNSSSYLSLRKYAKKIGINIYSHENDGKPVVCFFRSSSVALDYLSINVYPVYLTFGEVITGNVFDLDGRFRCAVLKVTSDFSLNLVDILNQIENSPKISEGKKIASYYLDQSYNKINLKQLIN
jgi:hypothetical protein